MFCQNCKKPIRTNSTGVPYCNCRFYANSRQISYVLIKTVNRRLFIKQSLWVVAQGGTVGLINDSVEIEIRREAESISITFNGERLGRAEYVSLPPFVEKLLSSKSEVVRRKQVTVITRREEAMAILSSTPGATLRAVENGRATIAIPI
jgi:hypothetical protein